MSEPTLADAGFAPTAEAHIDGHHARLLAATLDVDPSVLRAGSLPLPWHWTCFVTDAPTATLGADGHLERRPAMHAFPQRMWAGGRVRRVAPLLVDVTARRESTMLHAAEKEGAGGRFWLVTVAHTISQAGTTRIEEEQDIVFREPGPVALVGAPVEPPWSTWHEDRTAGPPLLFRYSALTFNTHRIHYDEPYATNVEGYPGLVVQGPLTATLLCELAARRSGRPVTSIDFRARAPLFAGAPFRLTGEPDDAAASATLAAVRVDGVAAMTAAVTLG